jgi:hypothetical protein
MPEPLLTSASFTLINATPDNIVQLDLALLYLQTRSPEMAGPILRRAAASAVRIVFSDGVINKYDGYGEPQHMIVWDPCAGLEVVDADSGRTLGVESPANGLLHEMVHAIDVRQAARNNPDNYPNEQYSTDSEATAVIYANAVAKDCGEPERNDYTSGEDIVVANPTAHTSGQTDGAPVWNQLDCAGALETGPDFSEGDDAPTFGTPPGAVAANPAAISAAPDAPAADAAAADAAAAGAAAAGAADADADADDAPAAAAPGRH